MLLLYGEVLVDYLTVKVVVESHVVRQRVHTPVSLLTFIRDDVFSLVDPAWGLVFGLYAHDIFEVLLGFLHSVGRRRQDKRSELVADGRDLVVSRRASLLRVSCGASGGLSMAACLIFMELIIELIHAGKLWLDLQDVFDI